MHRSDARVAYVQALVTYHCRKDLDLLSDFLFFTCLKKQPRTHGVSRPHPGGRTLQAAN